MEFVQETDWLRLQEKTRSFVIQRWKCQNSKILSKNKSRIAFSAMTSTILSNSTVTSAVRDAFVSSQPNTALSTGVEIKVSPEADVQASSDLGLAASKSDHWVKSVRIRSFSRLHFPAFGPNMERSSFSLNAGKYGLEKLRIRTLFTQWMLWVWTIMLFMFLCWSMS